MSSVPLPALSSAQASDGPLIPLSEFPPPPLRSWYALCASDQIDKRCMFYKRTNVCADQRPGGMFRFAYDNDLCRQLMIGVIIPAHNEAASIGACVRSVCAAAKAPELGGEKVIVIVVADDCCDHTETFALWAGAVVLSVFKRNVGHARAIGAELAIAHGARWLSFTDADSEVAPDWLAEQQRCQKDAVCGVVSVSSWDGHPAGVREAFYQSYQDIDGHRHIHGANLGCSMLAYRKAGGFQPLTFNEDVALVDALIATGASIAWTNRVRVKTSARLESRAPCGFGATLRATTARFVQSPTTTLIENAE